MAGTPTVRALPQAEPHSVSSELVGEALVRYSWLGLCLSTSRRRRPASQLGRFFVMVPAARCARGWASCRPPCLAEELLQGAAAPHPKPTEFLGRNIAAFESVERLSS